MTGPRTDALHRSLTAMRNALRSIVFNEGDCSRAGDVNRPMPCECAVCIARAALENDGDWRFDGFSPSRRKSMPREAAIHDAWRRYFTHAGGPANGTTAPMDSMLSQILFGHDSPNEVTERDWYIATTIVQWLATNVGQVVLFEAGYVYEQPKAGT